MDCEIDLDDDLLARAAEYSGLADPSAIANEALRALIEREERHHAHTDKSEAALEQ